MNKNMTNPSIGIIGIGNPLRKDDGIGIQLLDILKKEKKHLPQTVSLIDGGTGGMNLLHLFPKFDVIVLLDAVDFQSSPGDTRFFSLDDIRSQKKVSTVSTHNADVFQIIQFAQDIGECPKKIVVFGVQPADVCFGNGLTDIIKEQMNAIVTRMKKQVLSFIQNTSSSK